MRRLRRSGALQPVSSIFLRMRSPGANLARFILGALLEALISFSVSAPALSKDDDDDDTSVKPAPAIPNIWT
jgi:hypothetical protein